MIRKTCGICGVSFEATSSDKFCDDCKTVHKAQYQREFYTENGKVEMYVARRLRQKILQRFEAAAKVEETNQVNGEYG